MTELHGVGWSCTDVEWWVVMSDGVVPDSMFIERGTSMVSISYLGWAHLCHESANWAWGHEPVGHEWMADLYAKNSCYKSDLAGVESTEMAAGAGHWSGRI